MHPPLQKWLAAIAVIGLSIPFFFHHLGQFPIFQWDEARYANNSVEILLHGHWLDYRMDGAIDTWNFKPPLVLWLQAWSMRLFGLHEWGVRFPSALAGVLISYMVYWFAHWATGTWRAGVLSSLFFLASGGFIGPHIGRSADLDAVQTFFITLYALLFLRYLTDRQLTTARLGLLTLLVVCAFLCKGMPGVLLLPFLFLVALLHGNHRHVLLRIDLYLWAVLAFILCAGYYALRELGEPNYWTLVKQSEFNRFSGKGVEWHRQPVWFYLRNFVVQQRYYPLIFLLPFTGVAWFYITSAQLRRVFLYCFLIAGGYLAFISWPPVKLEWYDAPLYPFFALLFGIAVSEGANRLLQGRPPFMAHALAFGVTLLLCAMPYRHIWQKIQYNPDQLGEFEQAGVFIRQLRAAHPDWNTFTILKKSRHIEHLDQVKFYQKTLHTTGATIQIAPSVARLTAPAKVLITQPAEADSLLLRFPNAIVLFETNQGKCWEIQ